MLGGKLGPLREQQFRLLWLGRVSSFVGDSIVPVALAFAVLSVSHSATSLGLVLASFTAARVALIPIGGVYADRLPRRAVMLVCDGARAIVEAFTATMLLTGQMTLPMFFVTAAVFGAASAFFQPASTGLVPQTVAREDLQQANALLGMSQATANVLGPAISGTLVALIGAGWVFAFDALSFVLSAYFLLQLRLPAHQRPPKSHLLTDLAKGLYEVRARTWVWTAMISFSITNLCFATFLVLGPIVARDHLGGAGAWGWISTGGAAGAVVGGALALRLKPSRPLFAGFAAWTLVALPLLALAPPLPAIAVSVGYALGMAGISFGSALWEATLQGRIPNAVLSRVSSYEWLVSFAFMPIGFVLVGPLAGAIGISTTFILAASVMIVTNLLVSLSPPIHAIATGSTTAATRPATAKTRAAA